MAGLQHFRFSRGTRKQVPRLTAMADLMRIVSDGRNWKGSGGAQPTTTNSSAVVDGSFMSSSRSSTIGCWAPYNEGRSTWCVEQRSEVRKVRTIQPGQVSVLPSPPLPPSCQSPTSRRCGRPHRGHTCAPHPIIRAVTTRILMGVSRADLHGA